jgi:O-antigen ligase
MTRYTSLAGFLFFAIALIIPSGFSLGAVLLVLGTAVLFKKRTAITLNRQDILLIGAFTLYFTLNIALNLAHHAPGREYDAPARFVLAIIALLLLRHYPPQPAFIWSGAAIGGIGAGMYALWQVVIIGMGRAEGTTNAIQYGNISLILGIVSLMGMFWAWQQRKHCILLLTASGAALGLLSSLLSGSRGSWIALPVCAIIIAAYYANKVPKRLIAYTFSAIVVGLVALYQIPQTGLKLRITEATTEVSGYTTQGNSSTSVGTRLEMWKTGALLIPTHPWIGWGKAAYMEETKRLAAEGTIGLTPSEHSHLHNEYIDTLVKRGVTGLFALLVLYLLPLLLFTRLLKSANKATAPYALTGILLYVSYIMFGLTQAFLTHNNGVMILAFTTMIFWALARHHETA